MIFDVKLYLPDGQIITDKIAYTSKGPQLLGLKDQSNGTVYSAIEFSFLNSDSSHYLREFDGTRIKLDSLTFYRRINPDIPVTQDNYPPSSNGWIRYFSNTGKQVRIDLQKFVGADRYFLCIVDVDEDKVLRLHSIKSYESNYLIMERDWEYYNRVVIPPDIEEISLDKLLEAKAPSWKDLERLKEGSDFPILERYDTTGETLSQLIPSSFPENIRKELMVFLAWTLRASVPQEDPLDFLNSINARFKSGPLLKSLVFGHVQCLIQGTPTPQYVRLFNLAERDELGIAGKTQTEEGEHESWNKAWFRIHTLFPERNERIIKLTKHLNQSQEIHTHLPITREDALKSKDDWLDRFALIRGGFMMRGYIQDTKIGLEKMVYIGGAHRWPHKHLQYIARLGQPHQKPPYFQIILMPRTAVERLSRVKQNFFNIDWSASRVNFNLYNVDNDSWKYNSSLFKKSFNNEKSRKQLDKEFNIPSTSDMMIIDEQDTRLIDLLVHGFFPQSFEVGLYDDILRQLSNQDIHNRIQEYLKNRLMHIQYIPTTSGRVSICFDIRGPIKKLYSIARASLVHLPSATAMISSKDKICIIMARIPESDVYHLLAEFPPSVDEFGISMKAYRVSAYVGYLHNLYQRLRRLDGTWDDDISGLLDQITI